MRVHSVLAIALASTVVLAGCSSKSSEESGNPPAGWSSSTTPTGLANNTTTNGTSNPTGNLTNQAPTGSISASPVTGSAPLRVNFTLTALDADGDNLTWTLAFGDNITTTGTADNQTANHTYKAAGNYSAVYNLTDGNASTIYSVNITVAGGAAPPAGQKISGRWQTGATGCFASWQTWPFGSPGNGVDFYEFNVAASTIGQPFSAVFIATGPALFAGVDFFTGGTPGTRVGGQTDTNGVAPLAVLGNVPAGAVRALAFTCGSGASFAYSAG